MRIKMFLFATVCLRCKNKRQNTNIIQMKKKKHPESLVKDRLSQSDRSVVGSENENKRKESRPYHTHTKHLHTTDRFKP